MKRNMDKLRAEYKKLRKQNKGQLYFSDYDQIAELGDNKAVDMVYIALEVGVAMGYRIGKKESNS